MIKGLPFVLLVFCSLMLSAQPPGYYNTAMGKNGVQLKTALHNIIDNHSVLSFPLWSSFGGSDNKGSNILWDVYSDIPGGNAPYTYQIGSDQCGSYNGEGDCYNHEHLWPKSYYNDTMPMNSDLHHVYPTDGWVNNKRSNLPFGEVTSIGYISQNGSTLGSTATYPSYTGDVFEPIDSFKGDIARVMFYTSTRYEGEDNAWNNWAMANKAQLTSAAIQLLLKWHKNDPVSQKEVVRNHSVYGQQGNRNPFVDYPIFADCIWGTTDCTPLSVAMFEKASIRIFPNPADDYIQINFMEQFAKEKMAVTIYNQFGQAVTQSKKSLIDVSKLPSGIYFVRLASAEKNTTLSFTKL